MGAPVSQLQPCAQGHAAIFLVLAVVQSLLPDAARASTTGRVPGPATTITAIVAVSMVTYHLSHQRPALVVSNLPGRTQDTVTVVPCGAQVPQGPRRLAGKILPRRVPPRRHKPATLPCDVHGATSGTARTETPVMTASSQPTISRTADVNSSNPSVSLASSCRGPATTTEVARMPVTVGLFTDTR